MAGIGFRLQRLLASGNIGSMAAAYSYSAIIASGPWMFSMLSLVGIGLFMSGRSVPQNGPGIPIDIFCTVVTYAYAGSTLLGSLIYMGVSRYISDRLYAAQMEAILPAFLSSASLILLLGMASAGPWLAFSGLRPADAVLVFLMFQSLSIIWLAMTFLSAAKGYVQIVWGFCGASALGALLAILGYACLGLRGAFAGYAFGQLSLAIWLSWRIFREFPSYSPSDPALFSFLWKKRWLAAIGLLFNLGIWVDKFIVWGSDQGREVIGWFRCADVYDASLFFAYLTTIPAMAIFLIRIEASFYRNYSIYFNAVTCGGDLSAIEYGKRRIAASLKLSVERILMSQGVLTLFLIVVAPWLAAFLNLDSPDIATLRWALLAAFLQALLLFLLIFFLYFDWEARACLLSAIFCAANGALTWASLLQGDEYLGLGYLLALMLSLSIGAVMFESAFDNLEFETFAKQQIGA